MKKLNQKTRLTAAERKSLPLSQLFKIATERRFARGQKTCKHGHPIKLDNAVPSSLRRPRPEFICAPCKKDSIDRFLSKAKKGRKAKTTKAASKPEKVVPITAAKTDKAPAGVVPPTSYPSVQEKFSEDKVMRLYADSVQVSDIAVACGFRRGDEVGVHLIMDVLNRHGMTGYNRRATDPQPPSALAHAAQPAPDMQRTARRSNDA